MSAVVRTLRDFIANAVYFETSDGEAKCAEAALDALVELLDAARAVVVTTYDPSKTDAQNDEYQRRARRFQQALAKCGDGPEAT